jgi:Cdc6-like AAA superfamily ATPase
MDIKETIELIDFFNKISVDIKDVTNPQELQDGQKVVETTYTYENKNYTTKKLYYKNISQRDDVKNPEEIEEYFGSPVFWLDIEKHKWPKGSKENPSMERDVYPDITDDADFLILIKEIYGKIYLISREGRSPHYSVNLDNNNHLHDILLLIKEYINSKGNPIDREWFSNLVFKWNKKDDIYKRDSLDPKFGKREFISPNLETNIKNAFKEIDKMKEFQNYLTLLEHKHQIILQGPPGTGKTRLAKDIAYNLITGKNLSMDKDQRDKELKELESSEQYKLIQFHPAYSYEDFVRGIVAKSTGAGIEYKTENKILSQIAEKALTNYKDSKKNSKEIKDQINFELKFEQFIDSVQEKMDSKNREYPINDAAIIFGIENDAFKYYFPNSPKDNVLRMKFSDLKTLYEKLDYIKTRKDIEQFKNSLSSLAYAHRTYYLIILNKFREFITNSELSNFISQDVEQIQERKYILIIDEINRANLPAVLGELIYALEYRDQSVESMYDIDGDRKIVLPKNLYIIGTMNTADRSVGHIDYAIRRRFAFETIFPQRSVINSPEGQILFDKVADLFAKLR